MNEWGKIKAKKDTLERAYLYVYIRGRIKEREREREKDREGRENFRHVTQSEWRIEARLKENFHRFSIMDLDRLADRVRWNRRHR